MVYWKCTLFVSATALNSADLRKLSPRNLRKLSLIFCTKEKKKKKKRTKRNKKNKRKTKIYI